MGLRIAIVALFGAIILGPHSVAAWAHPPAQHEPVAVTQDAAATDVPEETASDADMPGDPAGLHQDGHAHDTASADPCLDNPHSDATGPSAGGHAHWGEDGASTPFERAMSRLGVFHAVAVHFPIALILAAALAQALVMGGRFAQGAETVRFLVWTGAVGGVAAGLLGWAHSGPMGAGEDGVMLIHRLVGTTLLFGLPGLAALGEWARRGQGGALRMVFSTALFGSAILLLINGFLGGALAHGGLRHLFGRG